MVVADGHHVIWTVMLYTWPYACIPLAFLVDRKLRARWILEDVSRPASGYRFKGANIQMVFTSTSSAKDGAGKHQRVGQSRWLECTNLWPLAVVGPAVFVFAAEVASGLASVLLVLPPFVFMTLFSLTLNQVCACVLCGLCGCGCGCVWLVDCIPPRSWRGAVPYVALGEGPLQGCRPSMTLKWSLHQVLFVHGKENTDIS